MELVRQLTDIDVSNVTTATKKVADASGCYRLEPVHAPDLGRPHLDIKDILVKLVTERVKIGMISTEESHRLVRMLLSAVNGDDVSKSLSTFITQALIASNSMRPTMCKLGLKSNTSALGAEKYVGRYLLWSYPAKYIGSSEEVVSRMTTMNVIWNNNPVRTRLTAQNEYTGRADTDYIRLNIPQNIASAIETACATTKWSKKVREGSKVSAIQGYCSIIATVCSTGVMQPASPIGALCPAYVHLSDDVLAKEMAKNADDMAVGNSELNAEQVKQSFRSSAARKNMSAYLGGKWVQGGIATRAVRRDDLPYGTASLSFKQMTATSPDGKRVVYIKAYFYFITMLGTIDDVASEQIESMH